MSPPRPFGTYFAVSHEKAEHMNRHEHWRSRLAGAAVAALTVGGVLAGCSSSSSSSSSAAGPAASSPAAAPSAGSSTGASTVSTSQCGTKPGVAATGTPINLGGIVTDQPGTSFTDIANMAQAYFACVNANGGINGHPIKYYIEKEQTNASQIASEAKQLVQTDHVVGIVGNTSIIECSVDHSYWESLGYYIIDSGIAPECWSTPNSAAVNMGPRYSSDGAVQYALSQHVSKVVFDQSNVPGTTYIAAGPNALAAAAHVPITDMTTNVPISDANSVAISLVDAAGKNGAVVLNFTPPDALVILQAAQKLNIEGNVKLWGCSTPCNTDFLAKSLGPKWNGKLFVNAELTPPDPTNTPTMNLYRAVLAQYGSAVSGGIGSFSQMGFVEARLMVQALESVKGAYTVASVNAAIKALKDVKTGMLCQQWTYGSYSMHIPNNEDYTVTPDNGKMVIAPGGGCTQISSVDPQIAAYRAQAGTAPADPTST
jgi:branched-chain amino acid transport system substrate-binding protein